METVRRRSSHRVRRASKPDARFSQFYYPDAAGDSVELALRKREEEVRIREQMVMEVEREAMRLQDDRRSPKRPYDIRKTRSVEVEADPFHDSRVPNTHGPPESRVRRYTIAPPGEIKPQISKDVALVLDPSINAKNVTVELEMDVFADLGDELEEFSRLRRLGRFSEARGFFHENLEAYISNPYVKVQYAEMLLAQGDYAKFDTIMTTPIFSKDLPEDPENRYLRQYHELLSVFRHRDHFKRPTVTSDLGLNSLVSCLHLDADVVSSCSCAPVAPVCSSLHLLIV